jgi:transposase
LGLRRQDGDSSEDRIREAREWNEELERIRRITVRFPENYRDDLEFELGRALLDVKRKRHPRIRDWAAYRDTSLRNRAKYLVKKWRRRDAHQVELPSSSELPSQALSSTDERAQALRQIQRRLPNAERRLLKLLKDHDGNISHLAKTLGVHRNTIHRRLRRLVRKCPIQIESVPRGERPPRQSEPIQLEALLQQSTQSPQQAQRARIVQALLDGRTYTEITQRLGASPSTIARCRQRFDARGVAGLKAQPRGRKTSRARYHVRRWLRRHPDGRRPSVRDLARRFGLSKSTIQRILKANA